MQGTIVYSTKETNFKVVPTPLVAVISGGLQRKVSRKEKIILNGSASHDPDFPETRAFRSALLSRHFRDTYIGVLLKGIVPINIVYYSIYYMASLE